MLSALMRSSGASNDASIPSLPPAVIQNPLATPLHEPLHEAAPLQAIAAHPVQPPRVKSKQKGKGNKHSAPLRILDQTDSDSDVITVAVEIRTIKKRKKTTTPKVKKVNKRVKKRKRSNEKPEVLKEEVDEISDEKVEKVKKKAKTKRIDIGELVGFDVPKFTFWLRKQKTRQNKLLKETSISRYVTDAKVVVQQFGVAKILALPVKDAVSPAQNKLDRRARHNAYVKVQMFLKLVAAGQI